MRILLFALFLILPTWSLASTTWQEREVLRIYQLALDIFHPEALYIDFRGADTGEMIRLLARDLEDAPERAARTGADELEIDPDVVGAIERFLVPLVWDHLARVDALPPDELLERYMEANPSFFERREMVRGARILVPFGNDAPDQVARIREDLEAMEESGETFRDVARRYYSSIGMKTDGYFGWRGRDRLRDELFDLFLEADPDAPWFGPVETSGGHLFGVLMGHVGEGMPPFSEVRQHVESTWLREHFAASREEALSLEEVTRGLVRHWDDEGIDGIPDPEDPAFELEGRVYTWGEARQWTPGIHGDESDPEFWEDLGRRAVQNFLVYTGSRAREVRNSDEFKKIYEAVAANWKLARAMAAELADLRAAPGALERFYEENVGELYSTPDQYRAIVWRFPMNPEGHENPVLVNESRRDAWNRATMAHKVLEESENPGEEVLEEDVFGPIRRHAPEGLFPLEVFPNPLSSTISQATPVAGWLSPVVIGADDYQIALVLEKQEGEPLPFDEVIDDLWSDWRVREQEKIRGKYRLDRDTITD